MSIKSETQEIQKRNMNDLYIEFNNVNKEIEKTVKTSLVTEVPIMTLDDMSFIFPNTITVIQGKTGTFKSRFAQQIGAAIIELKETAMNEIGASMMAKDYHLIYFDTERNRKHQFPSAMQDLIQISGRNINDENTMLAYKSLKDVPRENRLNIIERYIEENYIKHKKEVIIIIDVISDCVSDINNDSKSNEIIDYMDQMIKRAPCTFIVLIHENPAINLIKAGGYIGTELYHKCTTCIQLVKTESDLCILNLLKIRDEKVGGSMVGKYSNFTDGLILIECEEWKEMVLSGTNYDKASHVEVRDYFIENVETRVSQAQIIASLTSELLLSPKTAQKRLDLIKNKEFVKDGITYFIKCEEVNDRNYFEIEDRGVTYLE